MPLLVVCGRPCAGKSRLTAQLEKAALERLEEGKVSSVQVVALESVKLSQEEGYRNSGEEKITRQTIKAAIERAISPRVLLIADYLNDIKGFRYELFCRARAAGTNVVTVWCDATLEECRARNGRRSDSTRYPDSVLEDLFSRFEEPNESRRWEKPLFVIGHESEVPIDSILDACFSGKVETESLATQHKELKDADYLHELDRVTKEIVTEVSKAESLRVEGQDQRISFSITDSKVLIPDVRKVSMAELRKLRTQFIKIVKSSPISSRDVSGIARSFVEFLNTSFKI